MKIPTFFSRFLLATLGLLLGSNIVFAAPSLVNDALPTPGTDVQKGDTIQYSVFVQNTDGLEGHFTLENNFDQKNLGLDIDTKSLTLLVDNKELPENSKRFSSDCTWDTDEKNITCAFDILYQCRTGSPTPCVFGPPPKIIELQLDATVNSDAQKEVCSRALFTDKQTNEALQDEICHPLGHKNIELRKTAFPSNDIALEMGQQFEYYLRVFNEENYDLNDIFVQDTIDADLELLDYPQECNWDQDSRILTCFIDTLPAQSSTPKITLPVRVRNTAPDEVCNQAYLTESSQEYSSDQICHTVKKGEITLEKSAMPIHESLVRPYEPIIYTLTVHNPTTDLLDSVLVKDIFDEGLVVDNANMPENCTWNNTSREMRCLVSVKPTSFTRIEIPSFVHRSSQQKRICNTAELLLDPQNSQPSFPVCHTIGDDLWAFEKTATPPNGSTVDIGDTIDYLLTIENTEDHIGIEENIVITDTLDSNLTLIAETLPEICTHTTEDDVTSITCTVQDLPRCRTGVNVPCRFGPAEEIITIPFTTQVKETTESEILNSATLTYIDRPLMPYRESNVVTHQIRQPLSPPTLTKSAHPMTGTEVEPGMAIEYTLHITDGTNTQASFLRITDTLDDLVTLTDAPDDCRVEDQTLTCDLEDVTTKELVFTVEVNDDAEAGGLIDNRAQWTLSPTSTHIDPLATGQSNTVIHTVKALPPAGDDVVLTKSATPTAGQSLQAGNTVTYTITLQNTAGQDLEHVVLTDTLPSAFEYQSHTNNNCTGGSTLSCDFGTLAQDDTQTININVQTKDGHTGAFCNTASIIYDKNAQEGLTFESNAVCHSLTAGGGGGGGSADTHPTIGTCTINPHGDWGCTPRYPHDSATHHDPYYDAYQDCIDTQTEATCLIEWAQSHGYGICGPTSNGYHGYEGYTTFYEYLAANPTIIVPYPDGDADMFFENYNYQFGDGTQTVLEHQCRTPQIIVGGGGSDGCIDNGDIQIDLTILKEFGNNNNEMLIARGDIVDYKISVIPTIQTQNGVTITDAQMIIYDYTIPHTSGKLWYRDGILNADGRVNQQAVLTDQHDTPWTPSGSVAAGVKFTADIDPQDINKMRTIRYSMDSELGISDDVAQLQNVAFVRLMATYEKTETDTNGNTTTTQVDLDSIYGTDRAGATHLFGDTHNVCGAGATDPSSEGSTATVSVIRPFLDARGGGEIGNLDVAEGQQKLFGSTAEIATTIQTPIAASDAYAPDTTADELEDITFLPPQERDTFYEDLGQNTTQTETLWGAEFRTTPDQSGVYFREGSLTIPDTHAIHRTMTIVLEQGNLFITDNIEITDDAFVAFIVRNGDIWIDPQVTELDGVYIVDNEDKHILSRSKDNPNNTLSKLPLTISGGLIGNAQDLAGNRRFIGDNPNTELEPSIRILFDLRLLENTPPGLEQFLGGDWQQSVE